MYGLFQSILHELKENRRFVLATIVAWEGSSPRRTGSMMLVAASGRFQGSIGGGALEQHAENLALEYLRSESSGLHNFSLRKNQDNSIGMVCGGRVSVLFAYVSPDQPAWAGLAEAVLSRLEKNQNGCLLLFADGRPPELLDESARETLDHMGAKGDGFTGSCAAGRDTSFVIPLTAGGRAVIFGGGHIACALAPLLKSLDFRVVVFDDRPDYASRERFPAAEEVFCGDYARIEDKISLTEQDYVVIITEGHLHDFTVERQVLRQPPIYIGVIGSKAKTAFVNQQLLACGFREADLNQLHAPIGTRIQAVTPMEIAVSIAGEMVLVRAEHRKSTAGTGSGCPMH